MLRKFVLENMGREKELTERQQQCIDRRARHFSNKEVARQLGLAPSTVAMHLRLARQKLKMSMDGKATQRPVDAQPSQSSRSVGRSGGTPTEWPDVLPPVLAGFMLWLTILALAAALTIGLAVLGLFSFAKA